MKNFEFYAPTRVVFGKDTPAQAGALVKQFGGKKVLVHFGGSSAKKSGLLDHVCDSLRATGLAYVTLGGVQPNPRLSLVRQGVALARAEGVDFILAVGGGSVIDSAKAIAYGITNPFDVWDIYARKNTPEACAPVGCVLTIAAAGSEMSSSSVITNEENGLKRGFNSDLCRPRFAIMDPQLTYTLPAWQTACGCVDIGMHTMDRYFNPETDVTLTDALAEALLRDVMKNALILKDDPTNYNARAAVMWASSLSHNGLTGCGYVPDFAPHQLEHELSGMFDVSHGAGLAAVWSSWARYVLPQDPTRFAQYAVNVMGVEDNPADPTGVALAGIAATEDYYHAIGMPTRIHELNVTVTPDQLDELTEKCTFFGQRTIGSFRKLNGTDIKKIYEMAL